MQLLTKWRVNNSDNRALNLIYMLDTFETCGVTKHRTAHTTLLVDVNGG